ncbi:MAG: hypothetical protein JNJ54_09950 [Myxococcaceae bacterium]|nr:hypothetical protein [Myxococcaceae bacterium]
MRRHLGSLFLLFAACRGGQLATVSEEVVFPTVVDCGEGFIGYPTPCVLPVENRTKVSTSLALTVSAPFESDDSEVTLAAGERVDVPLRFRPSRVGEASSLLELTVLGKRSSIEARGVGLAVPDCTVTTDCRERAFDPAAGGCIERVAADGVGCGGLDRCLVNGVCRAGVCTGTARSCDDGDACTSDACDVDRGCVHEAVACAASTNPCEVALCDPRAGCRLEPVIDGAGCGPNDCQTAHVCVAGRCVQRQAPEGSICAPATACRAAGHCTAQRTCDVPPPGAPQEAWQFTLPQGRWIQRVAVAPSGDVFLTHGVEPGVMAPAGVVLISFDRHGQRRFELDLTVEDPGVQYGVQLMVDEPRRRLYLVTRTYSPTSAGQHVTVLTARDTTNGALLWKRDLRTLNVPIRNPTEGGGLALDVAGLASIGQGDLLAVLSEGASIHHLHLVAFEGGTGTERWRTERSGHGAFAVSGAGDVWLGWAACWSFDHRLVRFDGAGQTAAEVQLQSAPLAMSHDAALINFDGGLAVLERDLTTVRVLPLPPGRPDSWSGIAWSDGEVTTLTDGARPSLARIDVDGGVLRWTAPVDPSASWKSLRLIADAGVALNLTFRDGGSSLELYSGDGARIEQCDLQGASMSGLAAERLFSAGRTTFTAFELPSVFAAPGGWTGHGGLDGTLRPR